MRDKLFLNKLREKQLEVSSVPIQEFGILDSFHKSVSVYIKEAPWRVIIPVSIFTILMFKILTGISLVHIVSILQEGF